MSDREPLGRLLVGVACCALLLGAAAPAARDALPERARVVTVLDGDTLVVESGQARTTIRLVGVDTPELEHPEAPVEYLAAEARAALADFCRGKTVRLAPDPRQKPRDRFGRRLAYVEDAEGRDAGSMLLERGLGRVLGKYEFERKARYEALERAARAAGKGLWAAQGLDELRWLRARAGEPIEVLPMTAGRYAVLVLGWAKTGVSARSVDDALWTARRALGAAPRDRRRAETILEEDGFVLIAARP